MQLRNSSSLSLRYYSIGFLTVKRMGSRKRSFLKATPALPNGPAATAPGFSPPPPPPLPSAIPINLVTDFPDSSPRRDLQEAEAPESLLPLPLNLPLVSATYDGDGCQSRLRNRRRLHRSRDRQQESFVREGAALRPLLRQAERTAQEEDGGVLRSSGGGGDRGPCRRRGARQEAALEKS